MKFTASIAALVLLQGFCVALPQSQPKSSKSCRRPANNHNNAANPVNREDISSGAWPKNGDDGSYGDWPNNRGGDWPNNRGGDWPNNRGGDWLDNSPGNNWPGNNSPGNNPPGNNWPGNWPGSPDTPNPSGPGNNPPKPQPGAGDQAAGPVVDDYPYRNECGSGDETRMEKCQCTSFASWRLINRLNVNLNSYHSSPRGWGDAKEWAGVAASNGLVVNGTAAPGAIAQRTGGPKGHVAWVSAVDNNRVTIEDYNGLGGDERYGTGSVDEAEFQYIHF